MSTGLKHGIKGKTVKHTFNKRLLDNVRGDIYVDEQVYSLNKSKNWEIIEKAPKIQPKEPKEKRKENNRKLKKKEFEENLKTRGHKKDKYPNSKNNKESQGQDETEPVEKDDKEKEPEVKLYKQTFGYYNHSVGVSDFKGDIAVVLEPTEKEKWTSHRQKSRKGSWDRSWNHSDEDYERVKELAKRSDIDFKVQNSTRVSKKI